MSYIGRQLNNLSDRVKLDSITASATATYNLLLNTVAYVPSSAESLTVSLNGVIQAPQDSYTVSGSTITFASTLSASDSIDFILAERSITLQTPSAGSVGLTQLSATGTKDATTFLRGDNTFSTVTSTTINNNADNRIITGSSTANTLNGEANVTYADPKLMVANSGDSTFEIQSGNTSQCRLNFGDTDLSTVGQIRYTHSDNTMKFEVNGGEKIRISNTGSLGVGQTGDDGANLTGGGDLGTILNGGNSSKRPAFCFQGSGSIFNRSEGNNNSLAVINFYRNGSNAGTISASNTTVSYGTFLGVHYAQLTDDSKPDILVGTVLESINETCEWHQAKFTIPATEDTPERIRKEYVDKTNNVGDVITYNFEGTDYSATIIKENDEEYLARVKVSDTENSKAVYGVFESWMESETNDMQVASLGVFMIRVHKDETVAIGDYLQSKGDGTAKVQADDILRASTIAKVVKTNKIKTYDDGSYLVSCTLHCG